MRKCSKVVELIRTRIARGDYALRSFPAERQLAAETGVCYMTARRAVKELIHDGWIVRRANGRLDIGRKKTKKGPPRQIALLAPTFNSPNVESWRVAIYQTVSARGWYLRPVHYIHWDDPTLLDALNGFEAAFLIPVAGAIPPRVLERLKAAPRLIVVDDDWSDLGFISVQLFPHIFVQRLLDHFAQLGHSHIGCLNTQPHDSVILNRIGQWRIWRNAHGSNGQLLDRPVLPHTTPFLAAYDAIHEALENRSLDSTALLCTTAPAAVGAMRALIEAGIRPGRDIALGVVNGEGYAQVLTPSVTALEPADPTPYVSACLDWVAQSKAAWTGPLLLTPQEVPLVIRETSCARSRSR